MCYKLKGTCRREAGKRNQRLTILSEKQAGMQPQRLAEIRPASLAVRVDRRQDPSRIVECAGTIPRGNSRGGLNTRLEL